VAADPAEEVLVTLGVAPAKVGVEHIAGEVVRQQALRSSLDEGQLAQPRERLVGVLGRESLPQQSLGGDSGQRVQLQSAAPRADGDDVDESPHECGDEVGRQRVQGRLPTTHDDIRDQG
jgi:hypothetical protein